MERRRHNRFVSRLVCQHTTRFVGSATQLTTFGLAADWLRSLQVSSLNRATILSEECFILSSFLQMFTDQPILLTFLASVIGGSCVALTMQPFDVLATRLYNQSTYNLIRTVKIIFV